MSVAWIDGTTGPSESPAKGTSDGPIPAYPVARLPGRSSDRALLFRGRCLLRPAQPARHKLGVPQTAFGLGGLDPLPAPAASGDGERALLFARRPEEVLLAPVPGGSG